MKRAIPVLLLTVAGVIPLWRFEAVPHEQTVALADPAPVETAAPPQPGAGTPQPGTTTSTGSSESTSYGTVQVRVTFSGDRITDVQALRAPTSTRTQGALPRLRQSALSAQSADIDTVSGATQTSQAYRRSLQAALDAR
ncbi:uncharacterized protein with FMN-binding domain [Crossiella equi]|uniref:Uncharacterized protein with FMN-binding domain n=1 Tax=Crossiella equi TaxID=130796 RepID=A0ABS5AC71_9PSEU|nr:FMN-binding protein [Crossiella equi]MBP2474176.1 uncharacterized protein with FMN-binding domain [Crossiella equi]